MRAAAAKRTSAVEAKISAVLLEVEPLLRIEHCRLNLVEYSPDEGLAVISIAGGCPDCELSPATFSPAIRAHIMRRISEVKEVRITA
ncbi:MAG TPA: NifU family protein [Gemmatimonadaceae bacterium]